MKAKRVKADDDALLAADAAAWASAEHVGLEMFPAPLAMVEEASPFLARSLGHGVVRHVAAAAVHNGASLAIRLAWASARNAEIRDLDRFVDGVAVMFPLAEGATAFTMGSERAPVNAWLWRADRTAPWAVIGEGFASVRRLRADQEGDLTAVGRHEDGRWTVVFRRSLSGPDGQVKLTPGRTTKIAFAAWDGANAERSGRKSVSGEFVDLELEG
jgi:DMSO reductase family type II enzyme heme b subunit